VERERGVEGGGKGREAVTFNEYNDPRLLFTMYDGYCMEDIAFSMVTGW
jgi:hypothetical protein